MDPSYISDEEDSSAAMAAAMGFSSFGTQPSKRRKFNSQTDAVVDGDDVAALDRGGKKGKGSGGNTIPLGKPRILGVPAATTVVQKSNEEEINLEEEEDEVDGQEEGGVRIATENYRPVGDDDDDDDAEPEPQYIDTSLPPPNAEAEVVQAKIDAILSRATESLSSGPISVLPPRPPAVRDSNQRPPPRERGQKNELWYVGYYDPSFNENPWKKLENANGLESRGTWVDREIMR